VAALLGIGFRMACVLFCLIFINSNSCAMSKYVVESVIYREVDFGSNAEG
jgi:hypothetical protein